MGQAIGNVLALAMGVAVSPIPIVAVIVVLASKGGRAKGIGFVLGWLAGGAALGTVVLLLAGGHDFSPGSGPTTGISVFELVLGVLLLARARRRHKGNAHPVGATNAANAAGGNATPATSGAAPVGAAESEHTIPTGPKWLQAVDRLGLAKVFGLAVVLAAINPKNLVLTAAAAASIAQAQLPGGQAAGTLAIYVAITALGVGIPVVVRLAMGNRADVILARWRTSLAVHNAAVMTVLLLVFGVLLVGKGITGLSG
jgi:threonine/homoserine/homoserine lactone efflux protein